MTHKAWPLSDTTIGDSEVPKYLGLDRGGHAIEKEILKSKEENGLW